MGMLMLAPLTAYLPRTALAGVLILTAVGMVNRAEIMRILEGTRGDALIMLVTFLGTLFLPIEFAVLVGVLLSFGYYIMKTSAPRVYAVLPDESFKHFIEKQPGQQQCPQLGILKISGDLYFGAVNHVEKAIYDHLKQNPDERFLLLRLQGVNQCDFSGIHMLETIRYTCRERGGDLFLMKVQKPVQAVMKSTGFYNELGAEHFLDEDEAVSYLFYKILDPAVCIYECPVRAFKECQNLPKRFDPDFSIPPEIPQRDVAHISPFELQKKLFNGASLPVIIDVREPREYKQGHVPKAQLIPLPKIMANAPNLPQDREIVLVCRTGRRSARAAQILQSCGCQHVSILRGGILAWEAAGLLEAIEQ
jgi:SulP family sulfate permease